MALPRSVTVLGDKIRVLQVDAKTMKYEAQDDTAIGLALLLENKILILKNLPEKEKPRVLTHEIVHFILYKTCSNVSISAEMEEVLCQVIATTFGQMDLRFKKR
jgi:Zn-dependent peptidase ImmA (M78 family)